MWADGGHAFNCWLAGPTVLQTQLIAGQGYDSVVLDFQHGTVTDAELPAILAALSATDVTPLARVPWNERGWIGRLMDAGIYGVICPMVNNRLDAERFVTACRYPPLGERSFGPIAAAVYAQTDLQSYFHAANDTLLAIAQIETAEALDNLDEILSTPGLDAVYLGPADLSISCGGPPTIDYVDEVSVDRQRRVFDAAHEHGLKVCAHAVTVDDVGLLLAWGADLVTLTSDVGAMAERTGALLEASRTISQATA